MRSAWSDEDAAAAVSRWAPRFGEVAALRTYSSRLLGRERSLVLHGGGNTSAKDTVVDVLGDEVPALLVKGSGPGPNGGVVIVRTAVKGGKKGAN